MKKRAPFITETIDGKRIDRIGTPFNDAGFTTVDDEKFHCNYIQYTMVEVKEDDLNA